jgi:hypothetical protein
MAEVDNSSTKLVWQGQFQISKLETPPLNSKLPCTVSLVNSVDKNTIAKLQVKWSSEIIPAIQVEDVWTLQLHCNWSYSTVSRNPEQYQQLLFIHNGISVALSDSEYEQGKAAFSFGGLILSFAGLNEPTIGELRKLKQDADISMLVFSSRIS